MAVLKESRVALEEELKARSAALLQNAEEMAQHRAESSALRYSGLCVYLCLLDNVQSFAFHVPLAPMCFWKTEMSVCRLLQEQMEKSLSDVQHRLSVKASELQAAHQQMDKLEQRISKSSH